MKGLFSPLLQSKMKEVLDDREQIILFQNRRGYSPIVECKDCNWIPKCDRCDVSLTYHKHKNKLVCHYCGFEQPMPELCPSCGAKGLAFVGVGTEQIQEEVQLLFPSASIGRMDTDTTGSRKLYEQIIHDFEERKTDILIGTQMVSKGLDFKNVRLVGILNADQMLNFPDFRAHERSFQLMVQVSGRAGRSGRRGMVVIQVSNPDQEIIQDVINVDFEHFYERESEIRSSFSYPPFARIIQIKLKHKDAAVVRRAAFRLAELLTPYFGSKLLGPDQPMIARVNNYYYQQLLLKFDLNAPSNKVKEVLLYAQEKLKSEALHKSVQVWYDVDPG